MNSVNLRSRPDKPTLLLPAPADTQLRPECAVFLSQWVLGSIGTVAPSLICQRKNALELCFLTGYPANCRDDSQAFTTSGLSHPSKSWQLLLQYVLWLAHQQCSAAQARGWKSFRNSIARQLGTAVLAAFEDTLALGSPGSANQKL